MQQSKTKQKSNRKRKDKKIVGIEIENLGRGKWTLRCSLYGSHGVTSRFPDKSNASARLNALNSNGMGSCCRITTRSVRSTTCIAAVRYATSETIGCSSRRVDRECTKNAQDNQSTSTLACYYCPFVVSSIVLQNWNVNPCYTVWTQLVAGFGLQVTRGEFR